MKLIKRFLIVILILGIYLIFDPIKANLSGTGGVGNAGTGTITGQSGSWNSYANGFYIAVFDNENKQKGDTQTIVNSSKTGKKDDLIKDWIVSENGEMITDPTKLYKFLNIPYEETSGDYANLKTYISSINLEKGDYIIIEPFTKIGGQWNTFRSISANKNEDSYKKDGKVETFSFYNWYWRAAVLMANSAKVGVNIMVGENIYTAPSKNCTEASYKAKDKKKFCGWNGNKYIGYGLVVVKYEDMYGDLQLTKKDGNTGNPISGAGFTLYSDSSCTKIIKNETFTDTKGVVNFSGLNPGNVYYKETTTPSDYIDDINCRRANIKSGETNKKTVNNSPVPKKGTLTIKIRLKGTTTLITNPNISATFSLYKGNCNSYIGEYKTSSGATSPISLDAGTYCIKEKSAPNGYIEKGKNFNVTEVVEVSKNKDVFIYYDADCDAKLTELGPNPTASQLFDLYNDFRENTNLLNFSKPSCTPSDCKNNKLSLDCLSGSTNTSDFNYNNLSCYNGDPLTEISSNRIIGFCQTSYNLTNNLGTNKFYGKSGRLLITQNENTITIFEKNDLEEIIEKTITNNFIATATTSKICYTLNQINIDNINTLPQYSVYFGDNNSDKNVDQLPVDSPTDEENHPSVTYSVADNGLNMYTINEIKNYKLNELYLERITGKYSATKSNSTIDEPINGILSKFNASNGIIPFKVNSVSSNSCIFETEPQIIKYDKSENGKIDLEFRIIDTKKPFNRNTKSNWSNGSDNSKDNNTVKQYIINRNNSYDSTGEGYKYKIILTPSDIKTIRKYNKNNSYDNYEIYCNGNNECTSAFLYDLRNGILNKYENNEVIATYGTLQNRLETKSGG